MRANIITAAAVLLAIAAAAPGQDAAAEEVKQLRSALAETNKRVADLTGRVAELQAEVKKLQDALARARAADKGAAARGPVLSRKLDIRVRPGGWSGASTADIKKVLASTAGELWKHFPDRKLPPIIVEQGSSGPIVLYRKGPNGEHIVRLDVEGNYWCQFAYQFAHEFCHILTNYHPKASRKNKWLVESFCETASLFAIRRMAETWKTAPPYPNWKGYTSSLRKYADNARVKKELRVGPGRALAAWYRKNVDSLRKNGTQRDKNKIVASELLELLEADPAAWLAVGSLNLGRYDKADTFEAFLADWIERTPEKHKTFVTKVAGLFEVKVPARARTE